MTEMLIFPALASASFHQSCCHGTFPLKAQLLSIGRQICNFSFNVRVAPWYFPLERHSDICKTESFQLFNWTTLIFFLNKSQQCARWTLSTGCRNTFLCILIFIGNSCKTFAVRKQILQLTYAFRTETKVSLKVPTWLSVKTKYGNQMHHSDLIWDKLSCRIFISSLLYYADTELWEKEQKNKNRLLLPNVNKFW